MPHEEKLGFRDSLYSKWHRYDSVKRFLGKEQALALSLIDIDVAIENGGVETGMGLWGEFCSLRRVVLTLIETARYQGEKYKSAWAVQDIARRADIPALCVLYEANTNNTDIVRFYVNRLHPNPEAPRTFAERSPEDYAKELWRWREIGRESALAPDRFRALMEGRAHYWVRKRVSTAAQRQLPTMEDPVNLSLFEGAQ